MSDRSATIICIVNNIDIYNGFKKSLEEQTFKDYDLISVMNLDGRYKGAREIYNQYTVADMGRYVLFIHPDIRFSDERALDDIIAYADSCRPFGVLGVAGAAPCVGACGASENESVPGRASAQSHLKPARQIFTTIVQGDDGSHVGESIESPVCVQTLDECLFIIERERLAEYPFSDKAGWHLYCVEYCLNMQKCGYRNIAVPARVWHMSDGKSLNAQYMLQLEELIKEFRQDNDIIYTTVKAWSTHGPAAYIYRRYYYLKQLIKGHLLGRK